MKKSDMKEIFKIAYERRIIEPSETSSWGFDYIDNEEQLVLSDIATEYLGAPVAMFRHEKMIEEVGKEFFKELAQ